MAANLGNLLQCLRRLSAPSSVDAAADAVLLERFVHQRDEDAFRVLVGRHGPMVLRLCQRILGEEHAAEDALQATFLVLARKAGAIRRGDALASWLHGVAYRIARKARAADARRFPSTQSLAAEPADPRADPLAEVSARELLAVLDEELQRLPEAYRSPIILCCLQGRSQKEAARLLGWTPGSLQGRLERGRARLQVRLKRRGLTLTAALLMLEATRTASASAERTTAIVKAALHGSAVSAHVAALVEGALTSTGLGKLTMSALLILTLGTAITGASVLLRAEKPEARPAEAPAEAPPAKADAEPARRTDRHGDPLPAGARLRLGTMRFRHGLGILAVAFSPDGRFLVSAGGDGRVRLWDAATGKLRRELLHRPQREVMFAVFSPDGKTVAAGGMEKDSPAINRPRPASIHLLDAATGKEIRRWPEVGGAVGSAAFSPDGKLLATAGEDGRVFLWDVASGEKVRQLKGAGGRLAFSADGKRLVSAGGRTQWVGKPRKAKPGGGDIRIHDVSTGEELAHLTGEQTAIKSVVLSRDGNTLISGGEDSTIRIWDVKAGKERRKLLHERPTSITYAGVEALALSPDGKVLASGGADNSVRLWDLASGKLLRTIPAHHWTVDALAFAPDGKTLASGSWDGTMRLWDAATGAERLPFEAHGGPVKAVFSPDGAAIATCSIDGSLRLWDAANGKMRRQWHAHEGGCLSCVFSPDGKRLASGGRDLKVRLWDARTGAEVHRLDGHATTEPQEQISMVAFSPDGKRLVSGGMSLKEMILWDVATGKELRRLPQQAAEAAVFSPDGKLLAAAGWDAKVHLWDAAAGRELRVLTAQKDPEAKPNESSIFDTVAFSPDGALLATGSHDRTIRLWDVASGEEVRRLKGHDGVVWSVRFSPDGKLLASGGLDETVRFWEIASGAEVHRLRGHRGWVVSVDFAPEGSEIVSGSMDSTAVLWSVSPLAEGKRAGPRTSEELKRLWQNLAGEDAARAYRASWRISTMEDSAVAFLREHLQPIERKDAERVQRLIADLENDAFAVREAAEKELARRGSEIEPALRAALAAKPSLELRRRIQRLLAAMRSKDAPEALRSSRAVQALERIGTPKARQMLETLAEGAAKSRRTEDAKSALHRLRRQR